MNAINMSKTSVCDQSSILEAVYAYKIQRFIYGHRKKNKTNLGENLTSDVIKYTQATSFYKSTGNDLSVLYIIY